MRATGIIRRIDDLGRVVIPKKIRRSLLLKEGDALEIYVSDDGVTFIPYRAERTLEVEISRIVDAHEFDEQDNEKYREAISELKRIARELK
jgi:AbrB family looped-hinge helix DNA binding protein